MSSFQTATTLVHTSILYPWQSAGGARIEQPLARFYPREELSALSAGAVPALGLPRNAPIYLPLLAHSLETVQPAWALYASPIDPRDYLAVYEAWQSRMPGSLSIIRQDARPDRPDEDLDNRLIALLSEGLAPGGDGREDVADWASAEEKWFMDTADAADAYLVCAQRLTGMGAGDAPSPAGTAMSGQERGRIALFGDWLLGRELIDRLTAAEQRVVFIQKAFDGFRWPQPDSSHRWGSQQYFRPLRDGLTLYRDALDRRGVRAVIGVVASFANSGWTCRRFLPDLGRPVLVLECEAPGYLSAQNRIRLENFLARLETRS